jgi:hypothetical protein
MALLLYTACVMYAMQSYHFSRLCTDSTVCLLHHNLVIEQTHLLPQQLQSKRYPERRVALGARRNTARSRRRSHSITTATSNSNHNNSTNSGESQYGDAPGSDVAVGGRCLGCFDPTKRNCQSVVTLMSVPWRDPFADDITAQVCLDSLSHAIRQSLLAAMQLSLDTCY